jgi:protein phosphatase 1 regulatory subunit 7
LSFNVIRTIEGLDSLLNLTKLYLCSNKITIIENLSVLRNLTVLELGANRIRVLGRTARVIDALLMLRAR